MITEQKFLTQEELNQLMKLLEKYADTRDAIFLMFVLFTASRTAEALEVTKADLTSGGVTIKGKKNSNDRTVPLPLQFSRKLEVYVANMQDNEKLFPFSTRHARRIWNEYRPNQNKGLHCLRHTFCVRMYAVSKNIHAVRTAAGHKNIQNTMKYLEFVEGQEQLRNAQKGMWTKNIA